VLLDGATVASAETLEVTSPYDGALVGTVAGDGPEEVDRAVRAVARHGRQLDPEQRAAVLREASRLLALRVDEFATLITRESGVCVRETRKEVARAGANLSVAAEEALRLRGESLDLAVGGKRRVALTLHEPVGVVAAFTPFNRPLNQVVVKVAPAVAAGNAVVLKPSEKTPLTALALVSLLIEAGLPAELIAVVTGRPERIGPTLAGHELVDLVTFTGGTATGQLVARQAAGKKVVLELGGNDPLIVLDDADLDVAVRLAADGAYATAGQSCRGVKRVLVAEPVAAEFAALLATATKTKRYGDPLDPETDVGPLISAQAAEEVSRRCAEAVESGARVLTGGERSGALLAPIALDHVPPDARLVVEETFGPVAPIIRVRDAAHAAEVANSTPYGLQAGVVTGRTEDFLLLAQQLRVGAVNLMEGPTFDSPHLPFGGVKASGIGREGIRYSMREMSTVKTLTMPLR